VPVIMASAPARKISSGTRVAGLDVLRAIALALVLCRHAPERVAALPLFSALERGGWAGVDLFFVLSGYLVAGLLFRDYPHCDVARFLLRRSLKIYPAFYFCLVCMAVSQRASWSNVWPELFFLQNYWPGVRHLTTWSLGVEEHFYLLLAAVVVVAKWRQWPLSAFIAGVSLLIGGCLAARVWTASHTAYTDFTHLFPTHLRLDSLAWGVGLAASMRIWPWLRGWGAEHRLALCLMAVAAFGWSAVVPVSHPWSHTGGLTVLAGGGVAAVLALAEWRPTGFVAQALARVGRDSYSIYLWHMWALAVVSAADWPILPTVLAWPLLPIVIGACAAQLVEQPILAWRDRNWPSGQRQRSDAAVAV
jgi:peptidoglycan/LPS O-acetylase OafA/YrhL